MVAHWQYRTVLSTWLLALLYAGGWPALTAAQQAQIRVDGAAADVAPDLTDAAQPPTQKRPVALEIAATPLSEESKPPSSPAPQPPAGSSPDVPPGNLNAKSVVAEFKLLQQIESKSMLHCALSPDAQRLATSNHENAVSSITFWNLRKKTITKRQDVPSPILAMVFTPNSRQLTTVNGAGELSHWDGETGRTINSISLPPEKGIFHPAISADARFVAVSYYRNYAVAVLDAQTGHSVYRVDNLPGGAGPIRLAPAGKYLLLSGHAGEDGKPLGPPFVKLYDVRAKSERLAPLTGERINLDQHAFSPDGTRVAICNYQDSHKITIANLLDSKVERVIKFISPSADAPNDAPSALAFANDGRRLLCGGARGSLSLLNADTGETLAQQTGLGQAIAHLQFAADGRTFCSSTHFADGIFQLRRLPQSNVPAAELRAAPTKPPEPQAQAAALILVKDIFKSDFAHAQKPADKAALARKLLDRIDAAESTERYVLLCQAKDLAAEGADPQLFFQVLEELSGAFTVDASELAVVGAEALSRASLSTAARLDLVDGVTPIVERAASQEKYELAAKLLGVAIASARKAKDTDLVKSLSRRQADLKEQKRGAETARADRETLAKNPDDPSANLNLGKFYCLAADDWPRGLALLKKSGDEVLQRLAEDELKTPDNPVEQLKLADAWYACGQAAPRKEKAKLLAHAENWYRTAAPGLEGLQQTKAEKRLAELEALKAD